MRLSEVSRPWVLVHLRIDLVYARQRVHDDGVLLQAVHQLAVDDVPAARLLVVGYAVAEAERAVDRASNELEGEPTVERVV